MRWTKRKLRLACQKALELRGMLGDLCMENRHGRSYSALFTVGDALALTFIENTKQEQLEVNLKKYP